MKYRLIATDLDGTLLNSKAEVSEKNRQAIQYAISRGVQVAVCSGRVYAGAHFFAEMSGTKGPLISCNGAVVREPETEKIINMDSIGKETCLHIIEILKKEEMHFNIFSDRMFFSEKLDRHMSHFTEQIKNSPEKDMLGVCLNPDILSEISSTSEQILKIVAVNRDDHDKLRKVRNKIQQIEGVEVTSSGKNNFEILKKGVSKGRALEILCSHLRILPEETIAIGDNENDISMLKFAGLSVVMDNGLETVKNIADYVTSSNNEDGVAQAIMKFIP